MSCEMSDAAHCFENLVGGRIDREKAVIFGVSVITVGPAKGHGLFVDRKTLETVKQVADEFKNGVKVRFRHRKSGEYQNVIEETGGLLKNFTIDGDKLRGDLHLLFTVPDDVKAKIFEMAEKMPEQFGLSIDFSGKSEEKDDKKFVRCEELQSIDLTDNPAANPTGLFSTDMSTNFEIKYKNGKDGEHHEDCMCGKCSSDKKSKKMEEQLQTLTSGLTELTKTVTGLVKRLDEKNAPATALTFTNTSGTTIQLSAQQIAEAIGQIETFKATALDSEKKALVARLQGECRVVFDADNPGVALSEEDLMKKDVSFLKFAAANSQILPTQAKAVYKQGDKPGNPNLNGPDGKPLTGDKLIVASLEAQGYSDINQMIAKSNGKN